MIISSKSIYFSWKNSRLQNFNLISNQNEELDSNSIDQ